jgi:hypothetical protein
MPQRHSGYERKDRDLYCTPPGVTRSLIPYLPKRVRTIWEPAAGKNDMVDALRLAGYDVLGTDIATGHDFLTAKHCDRDLIGTNPPNSKAPKFIAKALELMKPHRGAVAMLLNIDFDCAGSPERTRLFQYPFAIRLVLRNRIAWFEPVIAAPSEHHCWCIWDWQLPLGVKPVIEYANPTLEQEEYKRYWERWRSEHKKEILEYKRTGRRPSSW